MLVVFIVASMILKSTARNFVFNGSTRISRLENWLNKDYPCQGDKIIFEENKKTVAFVDQSIQVSSILLPEVGSIVFSDNAVLGEKSRWQCTHRKSPENVFFQTDSEFAGFSDPASWLTDDKPLLHMNMVPGALDDVIFHDMGAFQISIDDQVTVNSLRVSKDWSMTTASFTQFVRTMEGQYQVSLSHALAKESSEDNISRMLPLKDPIIILNKKEVGNYNPNMKEKTMSLICNYVKCPTTQACTTTVKPKGHCCNICGGVMTFATNKFTTDTITNAIHEVEKENNLAGFLNYSIDRIDEEDVVPHYQVAVFSGTKYDDTLMKVFIMELNEKLSNSRGNTMDYFSAKYDWSRLDHSYALGSKIAGLITFIILLMAAAVLLWRNTQERERLRALLVINGSSPLRAVWHHGKEEADDVVQLLSVEELNSEEDEEYAPSLPALTPTPAVLEPQTSSSMGKNISEGVPGIELNLFD
ncbi:unnamed protein product [Cylicocyclus nassatus]|uniref:Protein amnionless n=1 Tax=Cylicocyclus nassatus TaxID=53992 RepID=A0AA36DNH1_CYLNA|nr:unnamed protein product [Cylicocyclus nassatus]